MRRLLQDSIALAVEALSWMELEGLSERQALGRVSRQLQLFDVSSLKLGFSLIAETVRRLNMIDLVAAWSLSTGKLDSWSLGVKNFLRLYIFWVHFRNSSPNEILSFLSGGRKVLGRNELLPVEEAFGKILGCNPKALILNKPEHERVSLETYHEVWFVEYCYRLLGRHDALALLAQDLQPPPMYIRTSTLKLDSEEVLRNLQNEGVSLRKVGVESLWRVEKTLRPLIKLRSYHLGIFQIQDLASQAACIAADPKPGDMVLDVCAAPGVKTCSLAQTMNNQGTIISIDISRTRMRVWKGEVERMGVKVAQSLIADACQNLPLTLMADVILVDPPCSSTGMFAKSPSMKWRVKPESIKNLSKAQSRMLEVSSDHVRSGGTLAYSTCSLLVEENEAVIERFLKTHPDFILTPISIRLGSEALRGLSEARRFYPHRDNCNGFFLAKMKRLD